MKVSTEQIVEVTAPPAEPVTLTEAKLHLRVDVTDDDALITSLITAAREYCEEWCQRSFVQHVYRAEVDCFEDEMVLPGRPVQAIQSIKYWDTSSPSSLEILDTSIYDLVRNRVRRNYGETWPSVYPRDDAVEVTFTTGYSDLASPEDTVANVPEGIKAAIKMMVGDLYENREGKIFGTVQSTNPTVLSLMRPFRVLL
jgi:uncharacterized phiE125 gp8 family phage protein